MRFAGMNEERTHAILKTSMFILPGVKFDTFLDAEYLSEQRLNQATTLLWFGHSRARGVAVSMPQDVHWDAREGVWVWNVEWRQLISAYLKAKAMNRRPISARRSVKR
jgi:hypothetical protein